MHFIFVVVAAGLLRHLSGCVRWFPVDMGEVGGFNIIVILREGFG